MSWLARPGQARWLWTAIDLRRSGASDEAARRPGRRAGCASSTAPPSATTGPPASTPRSNTHFQPGRHWLVDGAGTRRLWWTGARTRSRATKPELWLRLVRAPKLIDRVRADWGFRGVLVKFKLEVGIAEDRLLEIAERSRLPVRRGPHGGQHARRDGLLGRSRAASTAPISAVSRRELAERLLDAVEQAHEEQEPWLMCFSASPARWRRS